MLPSRLIALLGKPADEFFKNISHLQIRNAIWMQICLCKAADNQIEQIIPVESHNLLGQIKTIDKNITRIKRNPLIILFKFAAILSGSSSNFSKVNGLVL